MRNLLTVHTLLLTLFGAALTAQTNVTTATGRVTDSSGATLPNARIELTNIDTGQTVNATSDANGNFTIVGITPGNYRVAGAAANSSSGTPGQEIVIDA